MSPESYSWEIREAAEELYIIDGRTYEQVAETTGVSISQLKRWGTESTPSWTDRRKEYRQAQTSVRRGVMLAKAKLIESVIESEDPMKAFAFNSLVKSGQAIDEEARAARGGGGQITQGAAGQTAEETVIRTPADAVAALQRAVQGKINDMVSRPGAVSLAGCKDIKAAMEMIEDMKNKYIPAGEETAGKGGLSDEAAEVIRRQILGLKN